MPVGAGEALERAASQPNRVQSCDVSPGDDAWPAPDLSLAAAVLLAAACCDWQPAATTACVAIADASTAHATAVLDGFFRKGDMWLFNDVMCRIVALSVDSL